MKDADHYRIPAALGFFLALSALGQAQPPVYTVHGTVRNSLSREPIRNALLRLGGERVTLTGPSGEFHFEGVPEGEYMYLAYKPGYTTDEDFEGRRTLVLAPPNTSPDIEIGITPLGLIEGKVVDQYDEPLDNVVLGVYAQVIRDGEKLASKVWTVYTDDRGYFHLAHLPPGKYYVKAQARRGGTETHLDAQGMRYAPWEAFSPVYLGGATDIDAAVPVEVTAGSRVRADFRVEMQRSFRIRGAVQGFEPAENVSFELLGEDGRTEPSRATLDLTTGRFEILDVTPGNHRLRAVQGKSSGEVMTPVGSGDVNGVSITLLPGVTIRGAMRSADRLENGRPGAPCYVRLHQAWSLDFVYAERVEGNGEFKIEGLLPGEYRVGVQCSGAYVQSVFFGDVNLLQSPAITISAGATPPPIEIRYKLGGGTVKVKFASQAPSHGAVLLVPHFSPSSGPVLQIAAEVRRERPGGEFLFSGLAPGDYSVYGLSRFEDAEFRSAAFLRALPGGVSISVKDGETAQVTIERISQ